MSSIGPQLKDCEEDPVISAALIEQEDKSALLCGKCAQLDFGNILHQKVKDSWNGDRVMRLGTCGALLASQCSLCQLFGATSPVSVLDYRLELRIYPFRAASIGLQTTVDQAPINLLCLVVYPRVLSTERGHLAIESSSSYIRPFSTLLINAKICNLDIAREYWEVCRSHHVIACGRTDTHLPCALRVIDCLSRTVIDAPKHCQYAALSYVWGDVSSVAPVRAGNSKKAQNFSLGVLPKTIEDSITVTLRMSLRYLWVDRYCIDQSDHEAKNLQIKQMDVIYSLAEVTIIAAAGNDPNYGLPGINGTQRTKQQYIRLGEYSIRQTFPSAKFSLSKSVWSTRAWTYQEFFLSRRRLIFTSDQVYYECREMICPESLSIPLHTAKSTYSDECSKGTLSRRFEKFQQTTASLEDGISGVWKCIKEYSNRKLSFHEDTLNGMRGILEAARKKNQPVYHLTGLPVLKSGLSLDATQQLLDNLSWFHRCPSERVATLPSWSWAGWYTDTPSLYKSGIFIDEQCLWLEDAKNHTETAKSASQFLNIDEHKVLVWIENNASIIEYPSEEQSAVALLTSLEDIRFIHIRTWVTPLRLELSNPMSPYPWSVVFLVGREEIVKGPAWNSRSVGDSCVEKFRRKRGSLLGLLIPNVLRYDSACFLLVEDMGEYYERLGCIFVKDGDDEKRVSKWKDLVSGPKRTIRLG